MELVNRKRLLHTIRAYCIFRRCSIRFFPLLYTVWYLSITLYGYHTYGKVRFPLAKRSFRLMGTGVTAGVTDRQDVVPKNTAGILVG